MDTPSAQLSYTAYTPGTQAWVNAVGLDYSRNLISFATLESLLKGYVDPTTGALLPPQPSLLTSIVGGVGDVANVLFGTWAKLQQLELQQAQQEFQLQAAENALVTGMAGEGTMRGFGGINMFTLLGFAGVGVLMILVLKKT